MKLSAKAKLLRLEGKSFRDIAKELNIAVSTAHLWSRQVEITKTQKELLKQRSLYALQKSRKNAQKIKKKMYVEEVRKNFNLGIKMIGQKITEREYLLIGASLYWAEGFKRDSCLGFANSDPAMIKMFLYWLREILKIDQTNVRLRVGINMSFKNKIREIENFWSRETGIPMNQFNKPFFQKTLLKRNYTNRGQYYGVLRIRAIGQNKNFRKILGMVQGLKEIGIVK